MTEQSLEQEENPATCEKLKVYLTTKTEKEVISFDVTTHEACRTSQESADVRGVSLDAGAKALLIKDTAKKTYVLAVMSASHRFSSKAFKGVSGRKKIRFATLEETWEVTGCLSGAVPPFGTIFDIPLFVDRSLSRQERIYFNAGLRTVSISMTYCDYISAAAAEGSQCHIFTEEELALENDTEKAWLYNSKVDL